MGIKAPKRTQRFSKTAYLCSAVFCVALHIFYIYCYIATIMYAAATTLNIMPLCLLENLYSGSLRIRSLQRKFGSFRSLFGQAIFFFNNLLSLAIR